MKTNLDVNHPLFDVLTKNPPKWWINIKNEPELYIDVRKDNYISIYHNGASLMKLEYVSGSFRASINPKFIPLDTRNEYVFFDFHNDNIILPTIKSIEINNFEENAIEAFKERIKLINPTTKSEKGIQGKYITKNNHLKSGGGFFIDSEFAYEEKRIDIVWVDIQKRKIVFVELKTIGDSRLYLNKKQTNESIDAQLMKYQDFASKEKNDLKTYFSKVVQIKRKLGILPTFVGETSLEDFELIEKPILLVGDCTDLWIRNNAESINENLKEIAFGSIYHGISTTSFEIPNKTNLRRQLYRLNTN